MEETKRTRMIEELTEDEMYHVNYMDAMNMLFNMMATQFEMMDDETLESRYLSRFNTSSNKEVH
jgi:hypothetical protein